jgi:hypothetical protein
MRMFYDILLFSFCLNISAYLLPFFIALPVSTPLSSDPTGFTTTFSVETFTYLTVGGAAIGLAALLFRQGVYALYALLLWAVGVLLPIVRNFLLAVPILLDAVFPKESNPLYPAPNPIALAITAAITFAGFWFLMEFVTQRNVTT